MIGGLARHVFRPARGGAAGVVIVFAVLLSLAAHARFLGIPLALILFSWFFKYAYVLFDHTVRGYDDPPVLDIQMVNPADEQRPLGQTLILALVVFGVFSAYRSWGFGPAAVLGSISVLLLPASMAVLGLEGSLLKAANPFLWVRMAIGLGTVYLFVLAFIAIDLLFISWLLHFDLGLPVAIATTMFGLLAIFSVMGGALYERRDALGLIAWVSPERSAERERVEEHCRDEAVVTEAYGLLRADQHIKSWELLQNWLKSKENSVDAYRWLCEQAEKWDDRRYATRLSQDFIERLLSLKQTGEALKAIADRLRNDPSFRPRSAADTLSLAQLAARGGGSPRTARALLSDYAQRFPDDPRVTIAAELGRQLER